MDKCFFSIVFFYCLLETGRRGIGLARLLRSGEEKADLGLGLTPRLNIEPDEEELSESCGVTSCVNGADGESACIERWPRVRSYGIMFVNVTFFGETESPSSSNESRAAAPGTGTDCVCLRASLELAAFDDRISADMRREGSSRMRSSSTVSADPLPGCERD